MTDRIVFDARTGHAITQALFTGDVNRLVELLATYLAANDLKLTTAHIAELSRAGVLGTH